jgi:hypothetical protein
MGEQMADCDPFFPFAPNSGQYLTTDHSDSAFHFRKLHCCRGGCNLCEDARSK